jgi:hypothetical protein
MASTPTTTKPKGHNVHLLAPPDRGYLCEKICHAKQYPTKKPSLRAILGYALSPQLSMDEMLMTDYKNHKGKWRYVPEVSFYMNTKPPTPVMSTTFPNYPHWGWPRKGTRRPDVIIIDGANNHALNQKNIIRVVEVKFGKDFLKREQLNNYIKIAGHRDKVTVITDDDCGCVDDEEKKRRRKAAEQETATAAALDQYLKEIAKNNPPIYAPKPIQPIISCQRIDPVKMFNLKTKQWEWVVPTLKTVVQTVGVVVIVAVIVLGTVSGVTEAAALLTLGSRFVIAGADALAARYGAAAMGRLAQTAF